MTSSFPPKKGKSPVKWLLLAALVGVGVVYGPKLLGGKGGTPAAAGMMGMGGPVPVDVAEVVTKPVTEWHEFSGMFEAVNAVQVRPRVGGQITAIHFEDGAEVKKGQRLFTIDQRPYEAAMISAKATLAEAEATLLRAKKLVGSKAISRAEFDASQSGYDRALGNFKAAQVNLDYTAISAPISGKISRAEITVGNLVDPAAGTLLASIVDLSPIYASFEVDESSFVKAIQGKAAAKLKEVPVEVLVGNAGTTPVAARIHSFDNQITPGSGSIRVRALVENKDGSIVPGLYARVRLGSGDATDSVLVNRAAIGTDQDKKFVLVVDAESKAQYRPVTLGQVSGGLQVVAGGLKPGEKIVVSGLQRARPGTEIKPNDVKMETLEPLNPPPAAKDETAPEAKPDAGETK